jgi:hypothetical protein
MPNSDKWKSNLKLTNWVANQSLGDPHGKVHTGTMKKHDRRSFAITLPMVIVIPKKASREYLNQLTTVKLPKSETAVCQRTRQSSILGELQRVIPGQ